MAEKLYNLELIETMSGGDHSFIDRMVKLFIELAPPLFARIKISLDKKDFGEVKLAAHKLISPIEMLQVQSLKTVVRDIEKMADKKQDTPEMMNAVMIVEDILTQVIAQLKSIPGY